MEYALIGYPLAQSFAPENHHLIGKYLHHPYPFKLFEVKPEDFDSFMKKKDFLGINVTIPYKEKIIPYLDEISPAAKAIGAVNLVMNENGRLKGYNVDYHGLKWSILYHKIEVEGKDCLILGTGGTSKTAEHVLQELKAKSITKASHSHHPGSISYADLKKEGKRFQVIINTTPIGMYPHNEQSLINFFYFPNVEAVVDVIYNPLRTIFISEAKQRGIKYATGLYMLVSQGIKTYEMFSHTKVEESVVPKIIKDLETQKENIILIGMPSAGKTDLAKKIASISDFRFIDTDEEIEKFIQMPIKDYFLDHSVAEFRALEEQIISKISLNTHCVISVGSGAVLRDRNISRLKQNGVVFFLDRSLFLLKPNKDKPITDTPEKIEHRYQERYHLYLSYADFHLVGDHSLEQDAKTILSSYPESIVI
ncbi:MAG: shikimate dehydrogenase [Bacilli bacterium]|nr:shikimate dehydrogenase [Bacilli bacterium]